MIDVDDVDPMPDNDDHIREGEGSAADTPQEDDADSSHGDGDDAPQDEDDDIIEPLPGLPHEDYGREFDAPRPLHRWRSHAISIGYSISMALGPCCPGAVGGCAGTPRTGASWTPHSCAATSTAA